MINLEAKNWNNFYLGLVVAILPFIGIPATIKTILFLVLGIARFQISEFAIAQDSVSKLNDTPEKITLTGQVIGEPDMRDNFQKLKTQ